MVAETSSDFATFDAVPGRPAALSALIAALVAGVAGVLAAGPDVPTAVAVAVAAVAAPVAGALLVPAVAAAAGERARNRFAVAVGALTGALALRLVPVVATGPSSSVYHRFEWVGAVDLSFGVFVGPLGVLLAAVTGVIGALVLVYSTRFMERDEGGTRYYALILLFVGAMVGLVLSDNLVGVYLFWEVLGLCSFGLIAFWLGDSDSFAAGKKAFVTTRFGDIGLLAGIAVLYVGGGTVSVRDLVAGAGAMPEWALAWGGGLFLLAGVAKSAQFPLHVWLPDAMEAPTTATALIHAAAMVNAGVYLIARTVTLFGDMAWWSNAVLVVGTVSAFLAAVLATRERDFKRALAYCTISQLGYITAALGLAHGVFPASFHLLSHAVFKALLFLAAGSVIYGLGGTVHKHVDMYDARGVANFDRMPVTNVAFLVGLLGLMGVPPLNGFWSKEYLLSTARHGGPVEFGAFVVLAVTAVLTVVYSLRIYYLVFTGEPTTESAESPLAITGPLVVLAAFTATSWLAVGPLSSSLAAVFPSAEAHSLGYLVGHVVSPVGLGLTAAILASGAAGFLVRGRVAALAPAPLVGVLERRYGFHEAYRGLGRAYAGVCGVARRAQTGDLNYANVGVAAGVLVGLVVALVV